jgi:hypothetical protein
MNIKYEKELSKLAIISISNMQIPTSIQRKKGIDFHTIFHNHRQPCYTRRNGIHVDTIKEVKSSTTHVRRQFSRFMSLSNGVTCFPAV